MSDKRENLFHGSSTFSFYQPESFFEYLYGGQSKDKLTDFLKRNYTTIAYDGVGINFSHLKKYESQEFRYSGVHERERSRLAIKEGKTNFKEEDVSYTVNRLGIRTSGVDLVDDYVPLLTIGCSFTFGEGLPYEMTWSYLIAKKLKCSFENLGFPGSSISRIARILTTILPIKKPERVIVLLPASSRQELFIKHNKSFLTIDYTPGYPQDEHLLEEICKDYERSLSSEIDTVDLYKNLQLIKLSAEAAGTKVTISSWDKSVHDKLYDVFEEYQIAPTFHFLVNDKDDAKARDGSHPGLNPNKLFAEELEFLFGQNKINGQ